MVYLARLTGILFRYLTLNLLTAFQIQRIESKFTLSHKGDDAYINLPRTLLKHLNMKLIGNWTGKGSFVGLLPASNVPVYVGLKCDSVTGRGDVIVCSNDAMAANSITNLLKQALAN